MRVTYQYEIFRGLWTGFYVFPWFAQEALKNSSVAKACRFDRLLVAAFNSELCTVDHLAIATLMFSKKNAWGGNHPILGKQMRTGLSCKNIKDSSTRPFFVNRSYKRYDASQESEMAHSN